MNVEIGTKATQFPEKEYINGIFVAVRKQISCESLLKFCHVSHLGLELTSYSE